MAVASDPAFKRNVARIAFNTLKWGRDHVPPGVRSLIGALLMVGGVFGFLPILGFWMFPLGLAFAALDFPPARRWLEGRMVRLQRVAAGG
ncbi:MAG: hypothetical protein F4X81_11975 [Gammaproteobacteria bacterium]|nr:hypothetical protein [Gammaproteobacteria bacterium]MXW51576.1 hypothetical protein [Gammaproteobacteria bacterium]MYE52171.1 hypothetical protein [Gammaproteobacteria bacterium]MYE84681.1 hypothetical protein [Gammaproteobacteria bacterium]MYF49810.1 hypothetical protein [Gammaproteobacteria bacterium]